MNTDAVSRVKEMLKEGMTEQEIEEAYRDYQRTQFGGWPWPEHEQTHGRDKNRFALHADGTEELKDYL